MRSNPIPPGGLLLLGATERSREPLDPRGEASSRLRSQSWDRTTQTAWDRFRLGCRLPVGMEQAWLHWDSSASVSPLSSLPNTSATLPMVPASASPWFLLRGVQDVGECSGVVQAGGSGARDTSCTGPQANTRCSSATLIDTSATVPVVPAQDIPCAVMSSVLELRAAERADGTVCQERSSEKRMRGPQEVPRHV